MQENEFEKKIRLKMDELQLVPSGDVWKKVSANILKEKSKRRFLFLLIAFAFLTSSTALYFCINSNKTLPAFANADKHVQSYDSSNKKQTDFIKSRGDTEVSNLSRKINNAVSNDRIAATNKQDESYNNRKQLTDYSARKEIKNVHSSSAIPGKKVEAPDVSDMKDPKAELSKPAEEPLAQQKNVVQDVPVSKADSTKEKPSDKQISETKKDTSQPALAQGQLRQKIKVQANKKWTLGFSVFTGISNNLSGLTGGGAANYPSSIPPNNGNGNSSAAINKLSYKRGFSYSVGMYVKKQVSKTIGYSAGVNYHFASATSLAGSRNSTTQTFYDASFQSNAIVSTYYSTGQSEEYKNKYSLLELPLNVFIQLNKNQNKAISFTAGISPAFLIGSKALYANMNQNVYYENNDQFRKLLLMAQTGLQFTVFGASDFNVAAGPELQYGLNNMAKAATATKQHLSSVAVKVFLTLK